MKKIFYIIACLNSPFVCSMDTSGSSSKLPQLFSPQNTGLLLATNQQGSPRGGAHSPINRSRGRMDSDPIQRVMTQSKENKKFVHEENASKIYSYHPTPVVEVKK